MVFSSPVTGFASNDVSLSTSTAPGTLAAVVTEVGTSGTTYNVAVTGMTGNGTVVAAVAAGVVSVGSNANAAASCTVNYENTGPLVAVAATSGVTTTNKSPVDFTVTFSEPVANFTSSDVVVSGTAAPRRPRSPKTPRSPTARPGTSPFRG